MTESDPGYRPPAHPAFTAPSEFVTRAWGDPSRLTDRERSLLMRLAIYNLCRQFPGCTEEDAAEALDHFAALGKSHITGDQRDVYLVVNDQVHIHAERDWLRWAAHGSGSVPSPN
jgi:hypothetical protein